MKKKLCLLLVMVFFLSGCQSPEGNEVTFYYSRQPDLYQYFEENGVIDSEIRDLAGHRHDLRYMVGLYLAGPLDEGLKIPFTKSTRLLSVENQEGRVTIELSDHDKTMTDAEFTLACASLTMTCMAFTPCQQVAIVSGSRTLSMDADSILLYDTLPVQETIGG